MIKISLIEQVSYYFFTLFLLVGIYFGLNLNPHSLSWVIAGILDLYLAVFVYFRNKKGKINRLFVLMTIASVLWSLDNWGLHVAPDESFARLWSKIFRLGMFFMPPFLIHFVFTLTEEKKNKIHYLSYIISSVFTIINWLDLFGKRYIKTEWTYTPEKGVIYLIFVCYIIGFFVYALVYLVMKYRETMSQKIRNQIKCFFVAALVAIIFGASNVLLTFRIKIYPLGGVAVLFYTIVVAYAIVKYQLLDIEIIIKKSIVYVVSTVSIATTYAVIVGFFHGLLGTTLYQKSSLMLNASAAVAIAFGFMPLKNRIQTIVDKLFFRQKYNYQKTISEFTANLSYILGLQAVVQTVINTVIQTLQIFYGSLFLFNSEKNGYVLQIISGNDTMPIKEVFIPDNYPIIKWLTEHKRILDREIDNEIFNKICPQEIIKQTHLIIPLLSSSLSMSSKNKLVGFLVLGEKKSEEPYNSTDIELLSTMALQVAISIERAQFYEQVRELEKNLYQADKMNALGILASSVAHEIRHPITAIKPLFYALPEKYDSPEFREKFIRITTSELERMENIVNSLLDFAHSDKFVCEPVEISSIIENVLSLIIKEIAQNRISVVKKYASRLPDIVADGQQLKQLFMNLILNAVQSMPDGGELVISTGISENSEFLAITIEDTGYGISEENLEKIFKPFFTTKEKGTGLGLLICKRIVREHGGTIKIKSKINQGTVFTVNLPIAANSQSAQ